MKRTIAIKLTLSVDEEKSFKQLEDQFSAACNYVAQIAFQAKERNRVKLHHFAYYSLREKFPELGAQMACNAIAKTAQALRALKEPKEILFKKGCSVHFDKRTYSLKGDILSLFTLKKRVRLQLAISSFHRKFLEQGLAKEAELVRRGKQWFFHLVFDLPNPPPICSDQKMGVDFGENVLAALSTGKLIGGGALRAKRDQFLAHRRRLQSKGTKAAKQRLRTFVEYKAAGSGIQTLYVCPAYTSTVCSQCLHFGSRSKHRFSCSHCGSLQHSDLNASRTLLRLGGSADPSTGDVNRRHIAAICRR